MYPKQLLSYTHIRFYVSSYLDYTLTDWLYIYIVTLVIGFYVSSYLDYTLTRMFQCNHCGREYIHRRSLDRHVRRSHANQQVCTQCGKSLTRSANPEMHKRTCNGRVTVPATTVPTSTTTATDKLQFTLQQSRKALRGAVKHITINMMEAKRLSTLKKVLNVAWPAMTTFHQEHQA